MSLRHKYALNGECFFENARFHMEMNNFPEIPIGRVGGRDGWVLRMRRKNRTCYRPYIFTSVRVPRFEGRLYFNILKNDGSSVFTVEKQWCLSVDDGLSGMVVEVEEWLNEENGYLTNGGIRIEYGFQIDFYQFTNGTWKFNYHDPPFGSLQTSNMITFHTRSKNVVSSFYCQKQLLTFHSSYFKTNKNLEIELESSYNLYFRKFLSVCHRILRNVYWRTSKFFLIIAQEYKLPNVVRLVDQTMQRDSSARKMFFSSVINTRHCLSDWLKRRESSKKLAEELKDRDLEKCQERR
uniref:BTB domain-containing protein n=1 Tax=Caenorhabditis tropicalis TaxID=1561998 RepID=A0A1I7UKU1_9PELO